MADAVTSAVAKVAFAIALLAGASGAAAFQAPAAIAGSTFVPANDGTRLAVDVHSAWTAGRPRGPAILVMTRYGRGNAMSQGAIAAFMSRNFTVVVADMRGSGASFGHVESIFSEEERADIVRLTRWIREQAWSNGRIVTTGASHDGNLAALAIGNLGVQGAILRFVDQDTYRYLALPGGVRNERLLHDWGELTHELDTAEPCLVSAAACAGLDHLRPVGPDPDHVVLRAALLDHQRNWHAYLDTRGFAFSDDRAPSGQLLAAGFLSSQTRDRAQTPELIWASWLDAATADSALERFLRRPNASIQLVLGPWAHGGGRNLDPFGPANAAEGPAMASEFLRFATDAVGGSRISGRSIRYYTLGAGTWRQTASWPPRGMDQGSWWLDADRRLSVEAHQAAVDRFTVDFSAASGLTNRWVTQIGQTAVAYPDRAAADARLLTYTGPELARPLEITGAPSVELWLSSTHADGAIFAYLEAIAPDGRVVYLTEGIHRIGFQRESFRRADFAPPTPGVPFVLRFPLLSTSALVPAGWRIRLALAGHDATGFARYPSEGNPILSVIRGPGRSRLVLPQVWRERQ